MTDSMVLLRAAEIIERRETGSSRSPYDPCTCGHLRQDHLRGVGCVGDHCWYSDSCRRFAPDTVTLTADTVRVIGRLRAEARHAER